MLASVTLTGTYTPCFPHPPAPPPSPLTGDTLTFETFLKEVELFVKEFKELNLVTTA